jgi:hypothetical protein
MRKQMSVIPSPLVNKLEDAAHYKPVINWINENVSILEKKFETVKSLLNYSVTDEYFSLAINELYDIIDKIPLMATFIEPCSIMRARSNFDEIFQHEHQISYNATNSSFIKAGRFNRPMEPLFYGGLKVDNPDTDYILACSLESCKELIDQNTPPAIQDMTVGRWRVKNRFPVVNLCFSDSHLQGNQMLKTATDKFLFEIERYFTSEAQDFVANFWRFFSELSCSINIDNAYYILNALFFSLMQYYLNSYGQVPPGVIYPSAMSEGKGLNIALIPPAVDELLQLEKVMMFRFYLVKGSNQYVSYPCSDMVDVNDHKFTITGFVPNGKTLKNDYY